MVDDDPRNASAATVATVATGRSGGDLRFHSKIAVVFDDLARLRLALAVAVSGDGPIDTATASPNGRRPVRP
jgi:hypothetical protein